MDLPLYSQPSLAHGDIGGDVALARQGIQPRFVFIAGVGLYVEHGPYAPCIGVLGYCLHGGSVEFCGSCGDCGLRGGASSGGIYVYEVLLVGLGIALQEYLVGLWASPVYAYDDVADAPALWYRYGEHGAVTGHLEILGELRVVFLGGIVDESDALEALEVVGATTLAFHRQLLDFLLIGCQGFSIKLVRQVEGVRVVGKTPFYDELCPGGSCVFYVLLFALLVLCLLGFGFKEGVVDVLKYQPRRLAVLATAEYEELAVSLHAVVDFVARREPLELAGLLHLRLGFFVFTTEGLFKHGGLVVFLECCKEGLGVLEPRRLHEVCEGDVHLLWLHEDFCGVYALELRKALDVSGAYYS